MNNTLNIVQLIEKSPVTRLSQNYQGILINKIKTTFTDSQQQLFVASFYCYLNLNSKTDFVISLDDVWKWVGFERKEFSKKLLKKHFIVNIDYKIEKAASPVGVAAFGTNSSKNLGGAGLNKETILMNINTFKKFCLKANTKKADEIHDYFIKLEELLQETINEESHELRLQLEQKDKEIIQIKKVNNLMEKKWYNCEPGDIVYVFNNNTNDPTNKLINIGKTKDIAKREINYLGSNQNGSIVYIRKCFDCNLVEKVIHHILDKYRQQRVKEWFCISQDLAIYIVDVVCTFVDSFIGFSDNLLVSGLKESLDESLDKLHKICPYEKQIETQVPIKNETPVVVAQETFEKYETFIKECCELGDATYQVHPYDLIGSYILWNKARVSRPERSSFNTFMKKKFKMSSVFMEKFDTNLHLYTGIRNKPLFYKPLDVNNLTYFDEFFNENCHCGYTFKISCNEFNNEFNRWLQVRHPEFNLDKNEIIKLNYYISRNFLFDKISIPGHTNVDGILGFQLKSDPNPRYGILLSKRKKITKTNVTTNQVETFISLTSASRHLKMSIQHLSAIIKSNTLIDGCTLQYTNTD